MPATHNGQHVATPMDSPPESIDAEQSVLGAMFCEPAAIDTARRILVADNFSRLLHQEIYRTICRLHDEGTVVDLVTVQAAMPPDLLREGGNATYLTSLFDTVTSAANIEYHALIVERKAQQRHLQVHAYDTLEIIARGIPDTEHEDVLRQRQIAFDHVMNMRPAAQRSILPSVPAWPVPDDVVYHGLAGDFVRVIDPHTESDPLAIHLQLMAAFGNVVGRSAYFQTEADQHFGNLFVTLVGVSSKGRKGTSAGHIRRIFESVEPVWQANRWQAGLSSGEGLVYAVRDPIEREEKDRKTGKRETVLVDAGVDDKRLFVQESEFASVLKQIQRDGNTLSPTCRNSWDTGNLGSLVKNNPSRATGAHITIVGHITDTELRKELAETETANGFGNRFLWASVKRSKELPEGGDIGSVNMSPLLSRLRLAIAHAQETGRLMRDDEARSIWHAVYHDLSSGKPGLLGALTGRAEAQVMRLALLYALLDCDTAIRAPHLTAALALWEYCETSVRFIFGDALGDATADTILIRLRATPEGMTRTQISAALGRNVSATRLQQALDLLSSYGYACAEKQTTGGAPAELWKSTGTK